MLVLILSRLLIPRQYPTVMLTAFNIDARRTGMEVATIVATASAAAHKRESIASSSSSCERTMVLRI